MLVSEYVLKLSVREGVKIFCACLEEYGMLGIAYVARKAFVVILFDFFPRLDRLSDSRPRLQDVRTIRTKSESFIRCTGGSR